MVVEKAIGQCYLNSFGITEYLFYIQYLAWMNVLLLVTENLSLQTQETHIKKNLGFT